MLAGAVGMINGTGEAEKILASGQADLVILAQRYLRNLMAATI